MNYKKALFIAGCVLAIGGIKAQTATFNYTGSMQTWTVPCGVTSVTIEAKGAQGGTGATYDSYQGGTGGEGADVQATYTVTPGGTVYVFVGGQSLFNGGGAALSYGGGGNGGDASDVRVGGVALANRIIVAGGGGGGGAEGNGAYTNNNGGNGGSGGMYGYAGLPGSSQGGNSPYTAAQNGISGGGGNGGLGYYDGGGGGGGGGDGGGGAGNSCSYCSFSSGVGGTGGACGQSEASYGANGGCIGIGGSSTTGSSNGGGGGGGYYGGGGGSAGNGNAWAGGGGGGGGSSYTGSGGAPSVTDGVVTGNGQVSISWATVTLIVNVNTTTNETCNGGSNGSASSTVTGGGTPYTYAWTGGGTNAIVSGLTAGTFTLTVHDNCGNSASASVSITQPAAIVATITSTNVLCNGGNSGSASSTVTGGTGAYTYVWTGGGSNSSITGLTAGTYNLNVQDANGCTGSATVTITQPTMLAVAATETANVLCSGGSTGSASSTVSGGTMPYTYAWTGGGTTDTAVGLSAGTYTLSVRDANGCTGSAMVTITEPTALAIVKHAAADNGSSNGKAWVTVSGGTMPYTYAWTGGNTTDSISGKARGTYCCTVKDANGCMDSVCITIVSTAGIDGITSNGGQITVYPNPNNGQFTIQSSLNAVSTVEVYNVLGEKVFSGNLNTGNNTINMSNQSTGIYLYRVMSESGTLISEGKISVQK